MNFCEKVNKAVKLIPKGMVATYQDIAEMSGCKKAARAVGNILNKNYAEDIPCHRIIKSDGNLGGYNRGLQNKIKILEKEGVKISNSKVDLAKYKWKISWK